MDEGGQDRSPKFTRATPAALNTLEKGGGVPRKGSPSRMDQGHGRTSEPHRIKSSMFEELPLRMDMSPSVARRTQHKPRESPERNEAIRASRTRDRSQS